MRITELVRLRPVPCAGLLVTLTERCPLRCAHCSSASTMAGSEPDATPLLDFVASFGTGDRPEVLLLTGGEPLLRPELVTALAEAALPAGTVTAILTGAFFAARATVPARIWRAIRAAGHFSVSMDAFHEREVARADVLRLLRRVLDAGIPTSVHATGAGAADPYLAGLIREVRAAFGTAVPMLVNTVRPVGRAAAWARSAPPADEADGAPASVRPCAMAAWPVIAADGTVVACCQQATVDRRPVPEHLRLGHLETDTWPQVRERALASPLLRMLRGVGPLYLGHPSVPSGLGYCGTCRALPQHPEAYESAERAGAGAAGELLDQQVARIQYAAGPVVFLRRYASAPHAGLVGG